MTREAEIRQTADKWLGYYHPTCTQNMLVEAFRCGAEWADAHQSQVAYFEHEIERLKSKLQAADDLNTLLTAELEKAKSQWISVKERLPEKINKFMSEPVLCRYTRGSKEYFHVSQYDFDFDEWQISNVTHWMPIPELQTTK